MPFAAYPEIAASLLAISHPTSARVADFIQKMDQQLDLIHGVPVREHLIPDLANIVAGYSHGPWSSREFDSEFWRVVRAELDVVVPVHLIHTQLTARGRAAGLILADSN